MSDSDWYEVIEGPVILQGDVLLSCPVFAVVGDLPFPLPSDVRLDVQVNIVKVVVMTQSCDLANDKIDEVLLARLLSWPETVRSEMQKGNDAVKSGKFRKLLVDGSIPSLSLLHKRESEPGLGWSVVDFHKLYTLPKAFISRLAAASSPRLRLRSPYREHLAQAFARYFMRVGLPHDAKAFEKEGDVKV